MQDGVLKGWFRTEHSLKKGTVNLRTVALTAYEVASAMAFLHKHDIVHGVSAAQQPIQTMLA